MADLNIFGTTFSNASGFKIEDTEGNLRTFTEGTVPTGTISIDDEGTYDVTNYASAEVDIDYSTKTRAITFVINRNSEDTSTTKGFSIYGTFGASVGFSKGITAISSTTILKAGESTHSYTIYAPKSRPIIVFGTQAATGNYDVIIDSSYGECVDVPHILGASNTQLTKAIYLKTATPDAFTITINLNSQDPYPV